ncbi:hypothetical protein [uncultured Pseudokineococcus sp.]|nr:hypothetical protein [uncultured Pseudokineococcus sp.]
MALGHDVVRCTWAGTCTPGRVGAVVSPAGAAVEMEVCVTTGALG